MPKDTTPSALAEARRRFAEEIRKVSGARSEALARAFAAVARERFVGPGPWKLLCPSRLASGYWTTEDDDPRHLYHDVLVAIDPERHLNNGQPSLCALMLDSTELAEGDRVLHVGCGTGYYTAILAETVGPSGRVTALEIDERLAERARRNLEDRPNVTVLRADGCGYDPGPVDGIVVSAGASHPPGIWLDALRPGGRMVLPLTVEAAIHGWGFVLRVKREKEGYAARFVCPVGIFPCAGARDPEMNRRLHAALSERGSLALAVRSLRRRAHEPAETCWLHGEGFCLSTLPLDGAGVEPPTG